MRNPQIKVAIPADYRAQLEWAAAILGVAPATLASQLICQQLARQLDSPELRAAWRGAQRDHLGALITPDGTWNASGQARFLRDEIRRQAGTR